MNFYGVLETECLSTQEFVNQNSFNGGFLCFNPGLARLSYVKIAQDSRTQ